MNSLNSIYTRVHLRTDRTLEQLLVIYFLPVSLEILPHATGDTRTTFWETRV
jgi:hypothetical protein